MNLVGHNKEFPLFFLFFSFSKVKHFISTIRLSRGDPWGAGSPFCWELSSPQLCGPQGRQGWCLSKGVPAPGPEANTSTPQQIRERPPGDPHLCLPQVLPHPLRPPLSDWEPEKDSSYYPLHSILYRKSSEIKQEKESQQILWKGRKETVITCIWYARIGTKSQRILIIRNICVITAVVNIRSRNKNQF